MNDFKSLSNNDLVVMELIWEQQEATNASILKELKGQSNWTRYTVKTYVTRLREKKYVGVRDLSTRTYIYYPLVSKVQYLANQTSQYLNNHYENLTNMIAGLVDNEKVTYDELSDLEEYIKNMKAKKQGE